MQSSFNIKQLNQNTTQNNMIKYTIPIYQDCCAHVYIRMYMCVSLPFQKSRLHTGVNGDEAVEIDYHEWVDGNGGQ